MTATIRRRELLVALGGTAAAWPLAVRAQQPERIRRIGALLYPAADDPTAEASIAAFWQGLQRLGWSEGRNISIDLRWGGGDLERVRRYAAELVASAPDLILVSSGSALAALPHVTPTGPVVVVGSTYPVGAGYCASLSRQGGNTTGFTLFEYGTSGKWLELLKESVPGLTRAAVVRDPSITSGIGQFGAIQAVAPSLRVELTPIDVRDGEIEQAIAAFARGSNGGLIVSASPAAVRRRELIVALATKHRLPSVLPGSVFAASGGLISYGADDIEQHRQAAGYVDRILRGEKAADLPVQAPVKYALVINLKTAKALGLQIPDKLLALADE